MMLTIHEPYSLDLVQDERCIDIYNAKTSVYVMRQEKIGVGMRGKGWGGQFFSNGPVSNS